MIDDSEIRFRIDAARAEVLAWLRVPYRKALFLKDWPQERLWEKDQEIIDCFCSCISKSGFAFQLMNHGTDQQPAYEIFWTHRDFNFVGFQQPPHAPTPVGAKLLGCAALLNNEWCRSHLI